MNAHEAMLAAIRDYYGALPAHIAQLVQQARRDLHHGPGSCGDTDYPGFTKAVERIITWWNEHRCSLWYDHDTGDVCAEEPDEHPDNNGYIAVSQHTQRTAIFGTELQEYLR